MGSPLFFFFGLPARAAGRSGRGSACLGFGVAVPPCIAPGSCAASGFGWRDAGHVPVSLNGLLPAPVFCARRPRAGAQAPARGPRLPSYSGLRRACLCCHSSPQAQAAFACRAALRHPASLPALGNCFPCAARPPAPAAPSPAKPAAPMPPMPGMSMPMP